jgi:tetratricopeptide (TPR) repeat protein
MGVVYKARQVQLNRLVALKMILPSAHAGPRQLARFHLEAEAVASLQHPHIVQIYEVGEHRHSPYIALELVEGGSLRQKLKGAPYPPLLAAELVETLARAMHCAHQRGIVHRDLKPDNVLLTADGIPKITDFGLAKRLEEAGQTRTGEILGTPSYMAPEQAQGTTKHIGPAADTYALGAILYEMLAGGPPFLGESTMETVLQVVNQEPMAPSRRQAGVPRDLEIISLKCLEKDPARRYASAEVLAEDLRRFRQGEPILARPAGAWERAIKWGKRRPAWAAVLLISSLALVSWFAGGLWYQARLRAERDRAETNFLMARQAVDQMLTEVAEEQLVHEPRMEQKRRALLEKALKFYQEFLRQRSDEPSMREGTALAYRRLADILRKLGQRVPAKDAYAEAITLLGQLATDFPVVSEYRQNLAESYNWLGELQRTSGQLSDAEASYLKALAIQEQLSAESSGQPSDRKACARSHYNLGLVWKDTNRPQKAEKAFRQAIELLEELVTLYPEEASYRQELARACLDLGTVLRSGRPEEAEKVYTRARNLLQGLADRFPDWPEYRLELAVTRNNLGNLLRSTNRRAEAEKAHLAALELLAPLAAAFPKFPIYRREMANSYNSLGATLADNQPAAARQAWQKTEALWRDLLRESPDLPDYQAGLGRALGNLGWLALKQDKLGEAQSYLEQGIGHLRSALQTNPVSPGYRTALQNQYQDLAETMIRQKDHAEAVKAVTALAELSPDRAGEWYAAARLMARCVPLALADPKLEPAQRQAAAAQDAERAVQLLANAIARGYKNLDHLQNDSAFAPLREREDYRQLLKK